MRIGTRGSALALAQARWVADQLRAAGADVELVPITTPGDRGEAVGDKSRWVSALEQALLEGKIDVAVHSAKDVPAELADGLELVAFPAREDPRDAICGAPALDALPAGATIGTSSLRRAAQIRAQRADLTVVPLRGNVDTRLRKLAAGECDAMVIAIAGLARLGRLKDAGGPLDLVPAPGQGALAIQARPALAGRLAALSDAETEVCVRCERELVHALGASCNTPVGARAQLLADGRIELEAWVGLPDGSAWLSDCLAGSPDGRLGPVVAERMLAAGAGELLRRAEQEAAAL
jgi:hydroxymethylbilane synthase